MGWNEHLGKDTIRIFLYIRDQLKTVTELESGLEMKEKLRL